MRNNPGHRSFASARLTVTCAGAIGQFHQHGIKVYGWRWPAVKADTHSPHHFANDEAKFVVQQLIPAGLDGYIVDPESDSNRTIDDWNHETLAPLARAFCHTIKAAAPAGFHFGITSGCAYPNLSNRPHIPWAEFVAAPATRYTRKPIGACRVTMDRSTSMAVLQTRQLTEGSPHGAG
jgi:hypothetical protein